MRRVLIVTYYFPPSGGSGVHRPAALARHLRQFGYEPLVLTAGHEWHDKAMAKVESDECPDCRVFRTEADGALRACRLWRRLLGARLQGVARALEYRGLWARSAFREALRILNETEVDVILTTSPPYAVALAGCALRRKTGIPWVMDLRDPWALGMAYPWLGGVGYCLDRALMGWATQRADAVVLNTPICHEYLRRWRPSLPEHKVATITNGFRSLDNAPGPVTNDGRLRIAHVGVFYGHEPSHDLFQRVRQRLSYSRDIVDRSPQSVGFLLHGLRKAIDQHPELKDGLRVTLVGSLGRKDVEMVETLDLAETVRTTGHLSWREAAGQMRKADVLYLPFWRSRTGSRIPRVPSKTYEYIGSGKPILAMVDAGDTRDIIEKAGTAVICPAWSSDALADTLWELFQKYKRNELSVRPNHEYIEQYRWDRLVARMAQVLDGAIGEGSEPL